MDRDRSYHGSSESDEAALRADSPDRSTGRHRPRPRPRPRPRSVQMLRPVDRTPDVKRAPRSGGALLDDSLSHSFSSGAKGIRTPDLFHAMEARYQLRHSPVPGIASTSDRASEAPCRGDSSILHRPLSQMKSGGRLCDTNLMSWPLASAASGSITERWQFSNPLMPRKPLVSRPSIAVMPRVMAAPWDMTITVRPVFSATSW